VLRLEPNICRARAAVTRKRMECRVRQRVAIQVVQLRGLPASQIVRAGSVALERERQRNDRRSISSAGVSVSQYGRAHSLCQGPLIPSSPCGSCVKRMSVVGCPSSMGSLQPLHRGPSQSPGLPSNGTFVHLAPLRARRASKSRVLFQRDRALSRKCVPSSAPRRAGARAITADGRSDAPGTSVRRPCLAPRVSDSKGVRHPVSDTEAWTETRVRPWSHWP